MPPHGPQYFRRRFQAGSIVLILAIAAIALSSGHKAAAQIEDPRRLLELLKKKGAEKAKQGEILKKKQLTNPIVGKKQDPAKAAILPKNAIGKNVIGKATDGKAGATLGKTTVGKGIDGKAGKATLGKTIDGKAGTTLGKTTVGKGIDGKAGATLGKTTVGKGIDGKAGTTLGKTIDGKAGKAALGKTIDGKAPGARTVLGNATNGKALNVKSAVTRITRSATPVERLRLRIDHRRELLAVRRLLPPRPLPGQRGFSGVPPIGETRLVPTEMVFRAGPNISQQALDNAARRLGLTVIGSQNVGLAGGTLYHFRVAGGRPVTDVIRNLERENLGVASANYVYRLFQDADLAARTETGGSEQYVIGKLQLAEVHKVATGNSVLVAVIDSAIDASHPDFGGAIVETFDALGRREKPHSHGTGMVGAIAAHRKLLGVAPGARILAVEAFSGAARQSPEATTRQILAGLDWAIGKGARIINMSFAGPYDPMLQLAMKNAHDKGVVLIAAAGNLGPKSPPLYPAADPHVIAVTATDEDDRLFAQAVRGPHVAVAAPGVDIMVPAPERTYQLTTGTSVAAAHVSGVAALLIERHPTVNAATVLEVLTVTARNLSPKGRDDLFGWGLIDPAAALAELDSRMADGKVAAAPQAAAPKQPAPKQATQQKSTAPRLAPASAQ